MSGYCFVVFPILCMGYHVLFCSFDGWLHGLESSGGMTEWLAGWLADNIHRLSFGNFSDAIDDETL